MQGLILTSDLAALPKAELGTQRYHSPPLSAAIQKDSCKK